MLIPPLCLSVPEEQRTALTQTTKGWHRRGLWMGQEGGGHLGYLHKVMWLSCTHRFIVSLQNPGVKRGIRYETWRQLSHICRRFCGRGKTAPPIESARRSPRLCGNLLGSRLQSCIISDYAEITPVFPVIWHFASDSPSIARSHSSWTIPPPLLHPHRVLSSLANWLCCDYNFNNMLHGGISFYKPDKGWMPFHCQRKHDCERCRKVNRFLVLMRSSSLVCMHLQNHTLQQSSLWAYPSSPTTLILHFYIFFARLVSAVKKHLRCGLAFLLRA